RRCASPRHCDRPPPGEPPAAGMRTRCTTCRCERSEPMSAVQQPTASEAEAFIQRLFDEIVNRGNIDLADELFAEDYVDHGPFGDLHGREAFKQAIRQWRDAFPDVHCTISDVFAQGDRVAWVVHTTGTHTGDGL